MFGLLCFCFVARPGKAGQVLKCCCLCLFLLLRCCVVLFAADRWAAPLREEAARVKPLLFVWLFVFVSPVILHAPAGVLFVLCLVRNGRARVKVLCFVLLCCFKCCRPVGCSCA